jgi:hypothetical protein
VSQARWGATTRGTAIEDMWAALPVSLGWVETSAALTRNDHRTGADLG